jgi:hypothetical protein
MLLDSARTFRLTRSLMENVRPKPMFSTGRSSPRKLDRSPKVPTILTGLECLVSFLLVASCTEEGDLGVPNPNESSGSAIFERPSDPREEGKFVMPNKVLSTGVLIPDPASFNVDNKGNVVAANTVLHAQVVAI